jgi:hypothetical protein
MSRLSHRPKVLTLIAEHAAPALLAGALQALVAVAVNASG